MEIMEHADTSNGGLGENDCNFVNLIDLNICNDDSITETVKDCDDANVDTNFEKNSSDTLNYNDDSNFVDDTEINFEDIQRVCKDDILQQNINKACGQKNDNSDLVIKPQTIEIAENSPDKTAETELDNVGNDSFIKNDALDNLLSHLSETELYQCEYCQVMFTVKSKLERHVIRHLIWKKFECSVCGIKSRNKVQYKKHMKQHKKIKSVRSIKIKINKINSESQNAVDPKPSHRTNNDVGFVEEPIEIYDDDNININDDEPILNDKNNPNVRKYKPKFYKGIRKRKTFAKKPQEKKKNLPNRDSLDTSDDSRFNSSIIDYQFNTDNPNGNNTEDKYYTNLKIKIASSKFSKAFLKSTEELGSQEDSSKKLDQHIASSESFTVGRPVRNRTKHFDKDFEYDSSYLPKNKVPSKEISVTRVNSQKTFLKRKQFLQNETLGVEMTSSWEETNQTTLSKEETPIQKLYQGALQTLSLRVASQGRATMKQRQITTTRRNTPPFIRTPYRTPLKVYDPPNLNQEKFSSIEIPQMLQPGSTKKMTVVPTKASLPKFPQTPSTASKILEKSYSEKNPQKPGILSFQKLTAKTSKEEILSSNPLTLPKKKITVQQQTLPTKLMNPIKLDHQALSSDSNIISEEITMLNKSQYKNTLEIETKSLDSSLSILPSNGKNNSKFVNISLKQLKNMQKVKHTRQSPIRNVTKNISVLKNLEENNEIRISKVGQAKNKTINTEEMHKNKEVVELVNLNKNEKIERKIINIKSLLSSKHKHFFKHKYKPSKSSNSDKNNDADLNSIKNTKPKTDDRSYDMDLSSDFLQLEFSDDDASI